MSFFRSHYSARSFLAGVIGFLTALTISYNLGLFTISSIVEKAVPTHTIINKDEVHVHADFRMYIGDDRIRFTDPKYQSEVGHKLANYIHFHDGSDDVIHRHANGITLAQFFNSLGLKLTNSCVTLDTGISHCTGTDGTLQLLVNNKPVSDIEHYILADNDRIFLYYGDAKNVHLTEYMNSVTDLACLYTGTCPERGKPPTEGCGLTCDVADDHDQTLP